MISQRRQEGHSFFRQIQMLDFSEKKTEKAIEFEKLRAIDKARNAELFAIFAECSWDYTKAAKVIIDRKLSDSNDIDTVIKHLFLQFGPPCTTHKTKKSKRF